MELFPFHQHRPDPTSHDTCHFDNYSIAWFEVNDSMPPENVQSGAGNSFAPLHNTLMSPESSAPAPPSSCGGPILDSPKAATPASNCNASQWTMVSHRTSPHACAAQRSMASGALPVPSSGFARCQSLDSIVLRCFVSYCRFAQRPAARIASLHSQPWFVLRDDFLRPPVLPATAGLLRPCVPFVAGFPQRLSPATLFAQAPVSAGKSTDAPSRHYPHQDANADTGRSDIWLQRDQIPVPHRAHPVQNAPPPNACLPPTPP